MAAVSGSTPDYPLLFHPPPQPAINAVFSSEISRVYQIRQISIQAKRKMQSHNHYTLI